VDKAISYLLSVLKHQSLDKNIQMLLTFRGLLGRAYLLKGRLGDTDAISLAFSEFINALEMYQSKQIGWAPGLLLNLLVGLSSVALLSLAYLASTELSQSITPSHKSLDELLHRLQTTMSEPADYRVLAKTMVDLFGFLFHNPDYALLIYSARDEYRKQVLAWVQQMKDASESASEITNLRSVFPRQITELQGYFKNYVELVLLSMKNSRNPSTFLH